jgi:hypothetical protein
LRYVLSVALFYALGANNLPERICGLLSSTNPSAVCRFESPFKTYRHVQLVWLWQPRKLGHSDWCSLTDCSRTKWRCLASCRLRIDFRHHFNTYECKHCGITCYGPIRFLHAAAANKWYGIRVNMMSRRFRCRVVIEVPAKRTTKFVSIPTIIDIMLQLCLNSLPKILPWLLNLPQPFYIIHCLDNIKLISSSVSPTR